MDKEFKDYLDSKLADLRGYINEKSEETRRHFDVVSEGLRSDIRMIAEGHHLLDNNIERLREENEAAHKEILSAIKFSYAELDRRIRILEERYNSLEDRIRRLEAV
ncbi:MAG: hypothetical protein HZA13_04505 [Nitrospirae bacterium]|nr:hypothetical protein [Nitrospirota bacterium]